MRRIWGFAAFVLLGCVACSSSGSPGAPTSPAPSTAPAPSTSARTTVSVPPPPTRSAPSSDPVHTSGYPAPPHPPKPTVPADVPRTGPNTRKGERPPVEPLEATQHTTRGAKAFAAFFIKTIDWGYATTSSAYMRHYFTPACVGCRSTADALDKARRQHHHFIGDRFKIDKIKVRGSHGPDSIAMTAVFDVTSVEVVDRKNRFVDGEQALYNLKQLTTASWVRNHWMITAFTAVV